MKITTLIENLVYSPKLVAEHGLSLYIETGNQKILFDTGQTGLFIQNAKALGISIEDIDSLVLSHGHNDHTGGLYTFLENNSKAKVYAKRDILVPKYKGNRFIGTPVNEALLKDRLVFVDHTIELNKDVFIFPDIPIQHPLDTNFKGFKINTGQRIDPDEFNDELFMAIRQNDHINIITACSHRGITNICTTATEYFKLPIRLVLGGFHIKNCGTEQYLHLTDYLKKLQPKSLGVCHCTGIEKYAELKRDCEANVFYNFTGHEVRIS
jgi:7,8-dihydropterin-6-yl-methyl-4-(beta-D-ribofuranosyl)aminobenzene 5'-phosphate synthase